MQSIQQIESACKDCKQPLKKLNHQIHEIFFCQKVYLMKFFHLLIKEKNEQEKKEAIEITLEQLDCLEKDYSAQLNLETIKDNNIIYFNIFGYKESQNLKTAFERRCARCKQLVFGLEIYLHFAVCKPLVYYQIKNLIQQHNNLLDKLIIEDEIREIIDPFLKQKSNVCRVKFQQKQKKGLVKDFIINNQVAQAQSQYLDTKQEDITHNSSSDEGVQN